MDINGRRYSSRIAERKPAKKTNVIANNSIGKMDNIVKYINKYQLGILRPSEIGRLSEKLISEEIKRFQGYEDGVKFRRSITALQFHPTDHHLLGIGSECGQIAVLNITKDSWGGMGQDQVPWARRGMRQSITYITFDPIMPNCVLVTSSDGAVRRQNYVNNAYEEFRTFRQWYCSVNATKENNLIVIGDTAGNMAFYSKDLQGISKEKVHERAINTIEFSKNHEWLLSSASDDSTVKIWDIRKIIAETPLHQFHHNSSVNSAYFSQVDGNRLLTTDQHKEIRIYKGPLFELETSITHPHRMCEDSILIQASWHPLCDLIVVGRNPDPSVEGRCRGEAKTTVDVFSAETGHMILKLENISFDGISSLNVFNASGEVLASAISSKLIFRNFQVPKPRSLKQQR